RHVAGSGWGDAWVTPGGRLEEGETTVDGLRREVREEVGLDALEPILTRILQQTFSDGTRVSHGYFAQFVARASSGVPRRGPDVRALRTPPSPRSLHAGLAPAGDEALQGVWRGLARPLHPRDERRPIPSGPPAARGIPDPLEGNGSGARFVFGLPGLHRSGPRSRVDLARARCGRTVHLRPRDGPLCARDDTRRSPPRTCHPRPSRRDSRCGSETRRFGHGNPRNAREWRPFFGE